MSKTIYPESQEYFESDARAIDITVKGLGNTISVRLRLHPHGSVSWLRLDVEEQNGEV